MKWIKGSFTVELTLLMTVILPMLMAIIYMGFFLHNRAVLRNAAYEIAVYANLNQDDPENSNLLEVKKQEILQAGLIGGQGMTGKISLNENQVTVNFEGQMQIPGIVMKILTNNRIVIKTGTTMLLHRPGKTVVTINSLRKVLEGVTGEGK